MIINVDIHVPCERVSGLPPGVNACITALDPHDPEFPGFRFLVAEQSPDEVLDGVTEWASGLVARFCEHGPGLDGWQRTSFGWQMYGRLVELDPWLTGHGSDPEP